MRDSIQAGAHCQQIIAADESIGYCLAQQVLDEAELLNLVIFKPYQSKAYGRQALVKLQNQWEDQGIKRVFLEVRAGNIAAIKLYKRAGFKLVATRAGYYSARAAENNAVEYEAEDALVMRWRL